MKIILFIPPEQKGIITNAVMVYRFVICKCAKSHRYTRFKYLCQNLGSIKP